MGDQRHDGRDPDRDRQQCASGGGDARAEADLLQPGVDDSPDPAAKPVWRPGKLTLLRSGPARGPMPSAVPGVRMNTLTIPIAHETGQYSPARQMMIVLPH